jgi:S-(hydroxymethyl)glutathione dehydrogenase/alcohol dehydrogenase
MPRTTAAVLFEPRRPLSVEDLVIEPPRAGEVLVRVEAAGCCHSDAHYMAGDLTCPLPVVLGHEGAGVVEDIGEDVESVSIGDRVCFLWRPRCGVCRFCIVGRPQLCVKGRLQASTGGLLDGTTRWSLGDRAVHHFLGVSCFAERCVVSERSVVAIPVGVSAEVAAVAGCAVITGVGAVTRAISPVAGESLVVVGCGGVGLSAVMGASASGLHPIIAVDRNPAARSLAEELGATSTVGAGEDTAAVLRSLLPGGADWAVDAVGGPATLRLAFTCLRPGGTAVGVGLAPTGAVCDLPINELVQQEKRLVGSLYGSSNALVDLPRLFALHQAGVLPIDRLIRARHRLEDVNLAYESLRDGAVGRSVLLP